MANEVIKKMLQDGYNKVAFTDKYIMGWTLRHMVYFTICDRELVDWVTCVDKASRGAGYALRFKPTTDQKYMLMANGAEVLCSERFFEDMLKETYVNQKGKEVNYNRGEIFEKLITEKLSKDWDYDRLGYIERALLLMGAYEIDYLLIAMTVTMLCEQYQLSV